MRFYTHEICCYVVCYSCVHTHVPIGRQQTVHHYRANWSVLQHRNVIFFYNKQMKESWPPICPKYEECWLKTLDAKKVVFGFSSAVVDSNVIKRVAERLSMYSKVQVEKVENM